MSVTKIKQRPIRLPGAQKRELRTQFGAMCYRVNKGDVQVLLVTSRARKRWIVPKGWPVDGETPANAAAKEAFEEAGAEGKITGNCIGIYSYTKERPGDDLPCVVALYPLKVKRLHAIFPEAKERKRRWFSLKKAASVIDNPELRQMILHFDPRPHTV